MKHGCVSFSEVCGWLVDNHGYSISPAPDLAVEVLSPRDSASEVQEKAEDWLHAGCHEAWLIDPRRETAVQCTLGDNAIVHQPVETLTSPLLPGFQLPVANGFLG